MIILPWPPTINTYYTVARGRKILSKRGRSFKEQAWVIMEDSHFAERLKGEVSVFIRAYPPDKRKRDIDNILKPILDVLTAAGIYDDDSQVSDLRIQRFNPCKPGRVEVVVTGEDDSYK